MKTTIKTPLREWAASMVEGQRRFACGMECAIDRVEDMISCGDLIRSDDAEGLRAALARLDAAELPDGRATSRIFGRSRHPDDGLDSCEELPEGWTGPDGEGDYHHEPSGQYLFIHPVGGHWYMLPSYTDREVAVCAATVSPAEACRLATRKLDGAS